MRRLALLLATVALIAGCQSAPPEYVSHYTEPAPTTPMAALPLQASWLDDFNRPDTPGLGEGWDMRGRNQIGGLPPATDGFIKDGHYTYAGDSIVYAVRQFGARVRSVGTVGRWVQNRPGGETTLAMAITSNDQIIADMVHFTATRQEWGMSVKRGGGRLEYMATGKFTPPLELDRDYRFVIEATATSVTVSVPGAEVTKPVDTAGLLGDRTFWEEFAKPEELPAGVVFDFDTVWAVEDGQPVFPAPTVALPQ